MLCQLRLLLASCLRCKADACQRREDVPLPSLPFYASAKPRQRLVRQACAHRYNVAPTLPLLLYRFNNASNLIWWWRQADGGRTARVAVEG